MRILVTGGAGFDRCLDQLLAVPTEPKDSTP
jgi:hypothetical protein